MMSLLLPSPHLVAGHPVPLAPIPSTNGSKIGGGDKGGRSGERFRLLCCIVNFFIHRLLRLRVSKQDDSLHAAGTTRHTSISIITTQRTHATCLSSYNQEMQSPSSSHTTPTFCWLVNARQHRTNCDGCINDQLDLLVLHAHWDNQSDKSSRTTSNINTYSTRTAQMGTTTNNSQEHRVDMHVSDDETPSDENEKKMKGRRSYIFTMAASSLAGALFLVPYWEFNCSDATLGIPKIWMDVLPIGYIFLLITGVLVTGHSSQFKDGELPDNAGFKLLQMVQALVLLCLWAGLFTPLHVCRGMSYLVVWTCASGALLMIVISWSIVFHHKTVIKCIKVPYQMVIKCPKVMYEKVQQCLPDLSLPDV